MSAASLSALSSTNAPMFLKKAFTMISTCDPEISSWSDDGLSFVIRDKERFAREIIPDFFKHSNLSSYVRQLNFYGFRKVRSDPIRLKDSSMHEETRFYHEQFQRGRPDLLSEIKKPSQIESADKQEVEKLKMEVVDLKRDLDAATDDMERLKQLVGALSRDGMGYSNFVMEPQCGNVSSSIVSESVVSSMSNAVSMMDNIEPYPINTTRHSHSDQLQASFYPTTTNDPIALLEGPVSTNPRSIYQSGQADMQLVEKLHAALSTLPHDTQELLVERIVATVVEPSAFQAQVDAMTELAVSAARVAAMQQSSGGLDPKDRDSMEVATSILGAYIENIKRNTHRAGAGV